MKVYDRRTNRCLGTLVVKYTPIVYYEHTLYLVDTTGINQNGWDIEHCPDIVFPYKKLLKENRFYWNFSEKECKIKNDILEVE